MSRFFSLLSQLSYHFQEITSVTGHTKAFLKISVLSIWPPLCPDSITSFPSFFHLSWEGMFFLKNKTVDLQKLQKYQELSFYSASNSLTMLSLSSSYLTWVEARVFYLVWGLFGTSLNLISLTKVYHLMWRLQFRWEPPSYSAELHTLQGKQHCTEQHCTPSRSPSGSTVMWGFSSCVTGHGKMKPHLAGTVIDVAKWTLTGLMWQIV